MPRVEESIHINRPVADVFQFATDPENQTLISSNMIEYAMDGPMEKGARARGVTRVAGKRVEWTTEITEFEDGRRCEIRSLDAPMNFHIIWQYEADRDGCLVTFTQEVDELGGFFGRLADPIVTKMYARDVQSNLANLKILCEEGQI